MAEKPKKAAKKVTKKAVKKTVAKKTTTKTTEKVTIPTNMSVRAQEKVTLLKGDLDEYFKQVRCWP